MAAGLGDVLKLDLSTESGKLKAIAGAAIAIITVMLCLLNVWGAWAASHNFAYTGAIAGAEIFAVPLLGLIIQAPTWPRKIAGGIIFVIIVGVCIENGKIAIEKSFTDIFVGSPKELRQRAELAEATADGLKDAATEGKGDAKLNLTAIREEIAELKVERDLMASTTRVREAQLKLQAQGLYTGNIDGIDQELTKQARLARGEAIRNRLAVLEQQLEAATAPPVTTNEAGETVVKRSPEEVKREEAIKLREQADEVEYRTLWMHFILIGMEGARSFGVWCFLMAGTAASANRRRELEEAIELAALERQLALARNPVTPEAEEPDEPVAEPEPVLTPAQQRAQNAGRASAYAREVAKSVVKVPVGAWSKRADRVATIKVAAE